MRKRLTDPMTHLRALLSQSPTFQSWIGATGDAAAKQAAALARIYRVTAREPVAKRPFAVILPPDSVESAYDTADANSPLLSSVTLSIIFEGVATAQQLEDATIQGEDWPLYQPFADAADGSIEDVERLAQAVNAGWWRPVSVSLGYAPERVEDRDSAPTISNQFLSVAYDVTMAVADV